MQGFQAIAKESIIHRDIKPENILLGWDATTKAYIPKIIDFGLSENEDLAKVNKKI